MLDGNYTMKQKPKRGRPATARGPYNPNPPRQLGRVSDEDWQLIRDACEASGQSLVEWGLPLLLREARKKLKQKVA